MIEYMSTVILTGCGPEVCVTSNNTKQRLRRQTEGHWRRGEGGRVGEIWKQHGERKKGGAEREGQTEGSVWRELSFKTFK